MQTILGLLYDSSNRGFAGLGLAMCAGLLALQLSKTTLRKRLEEQERRNDELWHAIQQDQIKLVNALLDIRLSVASNQPPIKRHKNDKPTTH